MIETMDVAPACDEAVDTVTIVRQMAHELRQPLSTIESIAYYLDLILPRHDPRVRTQLERLQRLVEQSNWIVNNAVHFVQASPAAPEVVDLAEMISAAVSECPPGPPICVDQSQSRLVRLDPGQALHLFRNVISFFRSICPAEREVRVDIESEYEDVRVQFSAPVRGYSNSDVTSLFVPFTPCLPAGSGLSFASVRRILETHGGSVEVDAQPDRGVAVILRLPACSYASSP